MSPVKTVLRHKRQLQTAIYKQPVNTFEISFYIYICVYIYNIVSSFHTTVSLSLSSRSTMSPSVSTNHTNGSRGGDSSSSKSTTHDDKSSTNATTKTTDQLTSSTYFECTVLPPFNSLTVSPCVHT